MGLRYMRGAGEACVRCAAKPGGFSPQVWRVQTVLRVCAACCRRHEAGVFCTAGSEHGEWTACVSETG